MSEENMKLISITKNSFDPEMIYNRGKDKIYIYIIYIHIAYKLDTWSTNVITNFTLGNCLFGVVMLTTSADQEK